MKKRPTPVVSGGRKRTVRVLAEGELRARHAPHIARLLAEKLKREAKG